MMYQAEIKGAFTPVPVSVAGGARGRKAGPAKVPAGSPRGALAEW